MSRNFRLILTGLLIGLSISAAVATFSQVGASARRRYINLPSKNPALPFSDAVLVGDTLYLAGRLGTDPKTNQIPADPDQEVRFLLDSFKETLAAGGMTMDNLVTVTIYCPDLTLYDKFNAVYRSYFGKDCPARAFIGS
ncbi:MAG: RidA family protein, partial [Blastocatellia bacterium]